MHILGVNGEYVKNVIKNQSKSNEGGNLYSESMLVFSIINSFGDDIFRSHYFGVENDKAYSLFCDKFGLESINEDACERFNYKDTPIILTFGLFDEDALQLL